MESLTEFFKMCSNAFSGFHRLRFN